MPSRVFGLAVFLATELATLSTYGNEGASALPVDAAKVIHQVDRAAASTDWNQLRLLMADECTWSFGGDGDADQAIAAWKEEPAKYLKELRGVLTPACHRQGQYSDGQEHVVCPGKTDTAFRAGFTLGADGWKLRYFVEGD
jgi:hypothetical protein